MPAEGPSDPAPVQPARLGRFLTFILPATAGLYAIYQGVQQVLLPAQVEALDPANKVANLAVITAVFSIASTAALPVAGVLSDRTRGRFGRRAPWIVTSAIAAALLMAALSLDLNLFAVGTAITLLWLVLNVYQAATTATLPDRVPAERRGLASSIFALGLPIGALVGLQIASRLPRGQAYWALAAVLLVVTAAYVVFAREKPYLPDSSQLSDSLPNTRARRSVVAVIAAFFSSFRSRDFTFAFLARFLLFLAYYTVSGFLYYILQDRVGTKNLPDGNVAAAVTTITSISVVVWVLTAVSIGYLADRLNRRKLFVGVSSIGMAVALVVPLFVPTWNGMLIYGVLSGLFFGVYLSVDLALMTLVLPDDTREGRDLGVLAIATSAPQILSPVIAAILISSLGGYNALFVFGGCAALLGGLIAFGIRAVR
jgi:MFS family permease